MRTATISATTLPETCYVPLMAARQDALRARQVWAVLVRLNDAGVRRLRRLGLSFFVTETVECYSGAATSAAAVAAYADLGEVTGVCPIGDG